jgi:hypothetical protein
MEQRRTTATRNGRWLVLLMLGALLLGGCGRRDVEVVDLDKVLTIFDRVAKQDAPEGATVEPAADQVEPLQETDPQKVQAFLDEFESELNEAKLIPSAIGVHMKSSGEIEGFRDRDADGTKDSRDDRLFTIAIDPESKRIIATQEVADQTYRRDHYYHRHHYGGHWGYWMYGSMWGRQRRYYDDPGRRRPDYSRMAMSDSNYHGRAVQRARSSRRSARSSGGSRSFFGGK